MKNFSDDPEYNRLLNELVRPKWYDRFLLVVAWAALSIGTGAVVILLERLLGL